MPTEKRARQKEGRRVRLEAQRKVRRRRQLVRRSVIVVIVAGVIVGTVFAVTQGSSPSSTTTTTTTSTSTTSTTLPQSPKEKALQARADAVAVAAGCPRSPQEPVNTHLTFKAAPPEVIDTSATYTAVFKTDLGDFTATLTPSSAPINTNNFVFLARKGYYHCNAFFRVIPEFVNQTGASVQNNEGVIGYALPNEAPPKAKAAAHQYPLGAIAMANTGAADSSGSQFFIVTGTQGEALPNSYALIGKVTSGMDIVEVIAREGRPSGSPKVVHRILSITVTKS